MNEPHWDHLIHGYLDDVLTAAEQAEFSELVRGSEAMRGRFWELAEVHGLARDAARLAWPDSDPIALVTPAAVSRSESRSFRIASWKPVGLLAAGVLIGLLMSGLAWAIVRPATEPEVVLLAEGFESTATLPLPGGVPKQVGVWSGDFTKIITSQADVQPSGQRMLRFLSGDYEGKPNPGGYIGEIYRLIDVRSFRSKLSDGNAIVQVSAHFNAGATPDKEACQTSLSLYALDAATLDDDALNAGTNLLERALAVTRRSKQELDDDAATWQQLSTELRLPPNTDFLLLRIAVAHGALTRKAGGQQAFAAHYADDIRVLLTHRPLLP